MMFRENISLCSKIIFTVKKIRKLNIRPALCKFFGNWSTGKNFWVGIVFLQTVPTNKNKSLKNLYFASYHATDAYGEWDILMSDENSVQDFGAERIDIIAIVNLIPTYLHIPFKYIFKLTRYGGSSSTNTNGR